jgi:hypothetical protein
MGSVRPEIILGKQCGFQRRIAEAFSWVSRAPGLSGFEGIRRIVLVCEYIYVLAGESIQSFFA